MAYLWIFLNTLVVKEWAEDMKFLEGNAAVAQTGVYSETLAEAEQSGFTGLTMNSKTH